jgi:hypothetical protein
MADRVENRFELLFEESKKFSNVVNLPEDLILKIYRAETDWEFIIKIDALLEAAAKHVVKAHLNLAESEKDDDAHAYDDFVDALPMNGRTSLLALLKVNGCPPEMTNTIESVRRLRNGFAHDIRLTDSRLIEIIKGRTDERHLIKTLCQIDKYDEAKLIKDFENDPGFLRFSIVDATLRFLIMVYNVVTA